MFGNKIVQSTTMLWGHEKKKAVKSNPWDKRFAWLSCKKVHTCHP